MKRMILVVLLSLVCTAFAAEQTAVSSAQAAAPSGHELQFSVGYLYQGGRGVAGGDWFGMNGARADLLLPLKRHWGLVAEFSGVHAGNMGSSSGPALTLFSYMAGARLSYPLRKGRETRTLTPFAQILFGGAHASEGAFPSGSTLRGQADSFAMSVGGGLQVGVNRKVSVRLIQADYLYTRLPNLLDNYQNNYRIGAGVVLRLR
jgi:peptidoglycan-associated lipoprotein